MPAKLNKTTGKHSSVSMLLKECIFKVLFLPPGHKGQEVELKIFYYYYCKNTIIICTSAVLLSLTNLSLTEAMISIKKFKFRK